jgi:O-antigen/teichoic acid export membrane protein
LIKKIISSTLLRSSFVFTISNALNSAIPFFLIPVLTRYLSPSDYGIVSIFQVIATLLVSFTGLNAHNSAMVQFYKKDEVNFPVYVYNALLILLVTTILLLTCSLFFSPIISRVVEFPREWIPLIIIFSSSQFVFQLLLGLWIAEEKPILYGSFQISQTILNLSLSLLLVIPFELGWKGRIIAQVVIFSAYAAISVFILVRKGYITPKFNKAYIIKALRFGIPLIPHTLGGAIVMLSDRLIISNIVGISEVGVYMVGFQFAQIILLIQDSVNNAFAPWIYKSLRKNTISDNVQLVKTTYLYMISILLFSVFYSLLVGTLYRLLVGEHFLQGERYIFWISLGFAFNGMYKMVVNYIFYTEKTHLLAAITTLTAIVNIALTYSLVSRIGVIGAAYSLCFSYFLSFVLTWFFSNKVYPMPWGLKQ